jgi:hypothetical protein
MLSPWKRVASTEPFPLSSVMRLPDDNGRYRIDYHSGPEPGQRGIHTWTVSPRDYPAVDTYTTQWGQDKTLYYDPAVMSMRCRRTLTSKTWHRATKDCCGVA